MGKPPKQRPNFSLRVVEGEAVVLDRVQGLVHQMNKTATFIWQRCDGSHSSKDIADQLVAAFELSPAEAEKNVTAAIAEIQKLHLLES